MKWKKHRPRPSLEVSAPAAEKPTDTQDPLARAVADYAAQARAADELAQVDTKRLDTPTANPHAIATLNAERDRTARERISLDYSRQRLRNEHEHQDLLDELTQNRHRSTAVTARSERAVNEGLADADEAAAELSEVRAFERSASPATATRRLMSAVRGWRREEFAYAIAGSGLSAAGMSALIIAAMSLTVWGAVPIAIALEVVLTVRVIRLIGQRAELAEQHKGQKLKDDSAGAKALRFMTTQIVALLAVSVLINLTGLIFWDTSILGALGAVGAGAAALASWSAWQASVAVSETVKSNVAAWQGADWASAREELRARAAGAHIPTPGANPAAPPAPRAEDDEQAEAERVRRILAALTEAKITGMAARGTDALQALLDATPPAPPTPGGRTDQVPPTPGGNTPAGTAPPQQPGVVDEGGQEGSAPLPARGADTPPTLGELDEYLALEGHRREVMLYIHAYGREVSTRQIVRATRIPRSTVRDTRTALWTENFPVFDPEKVTDC